MEAQADARLRRLSSATKHRIDDDGELNQVRLEPIKLKDEGRLQGLEDDPTLPGQSKKSRYRQVGNGVPPQLVRALLGVH